jgi:hypothetical protein
MTGLFHNCNIPLLYDCWSISPIVCASTSKAVAAALHQWDECLNRSRLRARRARLGIDGVDINAPDVDGIDLRRGVGMVFQKSNRFPKSIYEEIAYELRIAGIRDRRLYFRAIRIGRYPLSFVGFKMVLLRCCIDCYSKRLCQG